MVLAAPESISAARRSISRAQACSHSGSDPSTLSNNSAASAKRSRGESARTRCRRSSATLDCAMRVRISRHEAARHPQDDDYEISNIAGVFLNGIGAACVRSAANGSWMSSQAVRWAVGRGGTEENERAKRLSPPEPRDAVRKGLPHWALEALQKALDLSVKELGTMLGIPERTVARRKDEEHVTAAESDRLYRVARTLAHAAPRRPPRASARPRSTARRTAHRRRGRRRRAQDNPAPSRRLRRPHPPGSRRKRGSRRPRTHRATRRRHRRARASGPA